MAGERLAKALRGYRKRYGKAESKKTRGAVLDEFCRVTGYHRKYAIALLRQAAALQVGVSSPFLASASAITSYRLGYILPFS